MIYKMCTPHFCVIIHISIITFIISCSSSGIGNDIYFYYAVLDQSLNWSAVVWHMSQWFVL